MTWHSSRCLFDLSSLCSLQTSLFLFYSIFLPIFKQKVWIKAHFLKVSCSVKIPGGKIGLWVHDLVITIASTLDHCCSLENLHKPRMESLQLSVIWFYMQLLTYLLHCYIVSNMWWKVVSMTLKKKISMITPVETLLLVYQVS